jgi:hypothetical protein
VTPFVPGTARCNSRLIGIAVAGLCCWSLVNLVAQPLPQGTNFDLEGTISHQEAGKLTIDSGGNIIFHATYTADTAIVHADGKPASEKDLKVGVKVHILGDLQESGEVKAQRIEIEDGKKDSASAAGL